MTDTFQGFHQHYLNYWQQRAERLLATLLKHGFCLQQPTLEPVYYHPFQHHSVQVNMLRLDQMHPIVSGNKWYKLKFNLCQAIAENAKTLITFGGAWSNHLHALCYLANLLGLQTRVIIRGEQWQQKSNPLLHDLRRWGSELIFVDRATYRRRNDPGYQQQLLSKQPSAYLIPEGGDNYLGLLGVMSMLHDLAPHDRQHLMRAQHVALACGTANTLVGMRLSLPASCCLLGIAAVKGRWYKAMVANRLKLFAPLQQGGWDISSEFHCGGFGKIPNYLIDFMADFETQTGILLDPVYSAKLLFAIAQLIERDCFTSQQQLVLIHTGGLQGRRSIER